MVDRNYLKNMVCKYFFKIYNDFAFIYFALFVWRRLSQDDCSAALGETNCFPPDPAAPWSLRGALPPQLREPLLGLPGGPQVFIFFPFFWQLNKISQVWKPQFYFIEVLTSGSTFPCFENVLRKSPNVPPFLSRRCIKITLSGDSGSHQKRGRFY